MPTSIMSSPRMPEITKNSTNSSTYSTDCALVYLQFRQDGSLFRSAVHVISVLFDVQSHYVLTV